MHAPGALFPASEPIRLPAGRPILCIIVDAEEEFHWGRPVSARNNTTSSIRYQKRAHEVFSCYDARPTYLVTYPIASDPSAASVLREYLADGRCDIGAQLHPWVTPPFDSETEERLSFPGNLPPAIEREKLHRLAEAVRDSFNVQPTVYKAGRYGFGPSTATLLDDEGFLVDTSLIPRTRYTRAGGPDFSAFDYGPFWFGARRRLLELPVTRALTGLMANGMPSVYGLAERNPFRSLRAAGLLARAGLLERITLSPEGSDLDAMLRLTRTLLRRGERIFTLSYHSPSLEPGNTPYVRTHRDLAVFLDRISGFLSFFRDELGGVFLTVKELHDQLRVGSPADAIEAPAAVEPPVQGANRCLVVANTFPPIHGGSAIVYDSLARFGGGRVSVLAPQEDYRDGWPIQGWREFDRSAPFKVHRIRLLRTLFRPEDAGTLQRIRGLLADVAIRLAVLRGIGRIVRTEKIAVLCIGELVAGGWLARACQALFGLKTVIYIHGEEISTRTDYDESGQRRRRALEAANGVVAVSRFTRDMLISDFGVSHGKIELVSNGVDLARFVPRPRPDDLVARYRLEGRRVLLTISRLYARKGMDRVIESLPLVIQQFPDLVYLIVGEGTYRSTLEKLVADHGLGHHVMFTGAVPDYELTDHYSLGDVFIMANREMPDGETEGFGLVFLEANACGLPVIAGKAGGSVDAVTDQVNGLVVDGDDTGSIAAAIIRMFEDDGLRESLRVAGAEVAQASGWDRRVDQFLRLCDQLTAAASTGPR
ncbi:glycosyltransferase [Acidisphaera sp. S103]|uniref:glycosyltransferase n=1 Tax=Acidisphaera sp. S103 TaxID=1747223 RepID=UPI00131E2979|nr:glycosyltransferase [Acidisphaera sp. S103]